LYFAQQCFARLPLPHLQGALRLIFGSRLLGEKLSRNSSCSEWVFIFCWEVEFSVLDESFSVSFCDVLGTSQDLQIPKAIALTGINAINVERAARCSFFRDVVGFRNQSFKLLKIDIKLDFSFFG
jgi:hypothetical protein